MELTQSAENGCQQAASGFGFGFASEWMERFVIRVNLLGRVVRKPINANPGLKVNRGNNFSCIKVLSIAYVLCSALCATEHEED